MAPLIGIESTRSGGWVSWSFLAAWLAAVVLVVPAGAEEVSLSRCLAAGGGQGAQGNYARHVACQAQREQDARRYKEAIERERQRREAEERQAEAQAKATANQDIKDRARQEAERARQAEAVERARKAEAAQRARKAAEEGEAARRTEAQQAAQRLRPAAEQFMPGMCPQTDLTAKCAMPQDPVLEQIRRSQENAAKGKLSR